MEYLLIERSSSEECGTNTVIYGVFTDGSLALQGLEDLKAYLEKKEPMFYKEATSTSMGYEFKNGHEICLEEIEPDKVLFEDWIT